MDATANRDRLARHLIGSGLELGPGHNPFVLTLPGTSVRFVDRWRPDQNLDLFPELEGESFPEPDVVANFDTDRLGPIEDESQDFLICSHVLEHLAEPLGFLTDMHRVLRPGGSALVLLPDRHRTFDRLREPTALTHLIAEHEAGVCEVDDDHILEFLRSTGSIEEGGSDPEGEQAAHDPQEGDRAGGQGRGTCGAAARLELYRRRSIHVHCWDEVEFFEVLAYAVRHLGQRWEFVDGLLTEDGGEASIEFGYVLRKLPANVPLDIVADRFVASGNAWRAQRAAERRAAGAEAEALRHELTAVYATRTFRYSRLLRSYYGRLRRS